MARDYEPFLIADFRSALRTDLKPWLLPQDAFPVMKNWYMQNGVIYKRDGYTEFGRFANGIKVTRSTYAFVNTNPDTITDSSNNFINDGFTAGKILSVSGATQAQNNLIYNTVDTVAAGTLTLSASASVVAEGPGTVTLYQKVLTYPSLPIMGITNFINSSGTNDLIIFSTKRLNKWNNTPGIEDFEDWLGADTFTGTDKDYFWTKNWKGVMFITNGKDTIRIWSPANTLKVMTAALPLSGTINTCRLLLPHKERLLLFRPTEDGVIKPNRVRWCKPGVVYNTGTDTVSIDWTNDEFSDAPTGSWIISAEYLDNDILVWFDDGPRMLRYTGDASLPFRWDDKIGTVGGGRSLKSAIRQDNTVQVMGANSPLITDGLDVKRMDIKIPDRALTFDLSNLDYCFSAFADRYRQIWMQYPVSGVGSKEVLVFNYEDKSWFIYGINLHCYGEHNLLTTYTWDTITLTWDEIQWAWDDPQQSAGYPLLLGGSTTGYIYKMNDGGGDAGSAIDAIIESGQLNPYSKQGKKARLGWVDLLVDRNPAITLTLDFYVNQDSLSFLTLSETLTDGTTNEQVWIRFDVGEIGDFHKFKITNNASNQKPAIHAIVPYFRQVEKRK